ncbi:MAG: peptidoglycan DD-metalloendopeptidase family protein [Lachnospiraceae bacterium]|nr:peptidoglycan DD-metalloendopeptidase family protein [Lachnospiraceae bacterium]
MGNRNRKHRKNNSISKKNKPVVQVLGDLQKEDTPELPKEAKEEQGMGTPEGLVAEEQGTKASEEPDEPISEAEAEPQMQTGEASGTGSTEDTEITDESETETLSGFRILDIQAKPDAEDKTAETMIEPQPETNTEEPEETVEAEANTEEPEETVEAEANTEEPEEPVEADADINESGTSGSADAEEQSADTDKSEVSGLDVKPKKKVVREVEAVRQEPADEIREAKRATGRYNILFVSEGTRHVRTIHTSAERILLVTALVAIIIGALIAYILHWSSVKEEYEDRIDALNDQITTLSEDKILLQADIENLDQELKEANDKLSQHDSQAQAKTEEQALLYMPSALPLDSQALPSEFDKENKWITMDAAPGVRVVATGAGTVTYAGESVEAGGYLVSVDHGNGYQSNYYCQSAPVVKENAAVNRGTALFVIGNETDKLIYRIQYEGDYIDPYTVLNIAG